MHHVEDCIFCRITAGEAPCFKVYEDELTISFLDIFPASPGHSLIVTKEHFTDIFEVSTAAIAQVASNSVRLAKAIDEVFSPDGLGIYQLNRPAAGQTVFHYHMHLIPRMGGQTMEVHSKQAGDQQTLAKHAEQLSRALGGQLQG